MRMNWNVCRKWVRSHLVKKNDQPTDRKNISHSNGFTNINSFANLNFDVYISICSPFENSFSCLARLSTHEVCVFLVISLYEMCVCYSCLFLCYKNGVPLSLGKSLVSVHPLDSHSDPDASISLGCRKVERPTFGFCCWINQDVVSPTWNEKKFFFRNSIYSDRGKGKKSWGFIAYL